MNEVVLQRLNTPNENGVVFTREAFDAQLNSLDPSSLGQRLKAGLVVGEFNPEDRTAQLVDPDNVCVKIYSAFISDGCVMGMVAAEGPKAKLLQEIIDARLPITLQMRALVEQSDPTNPKKVTRLNNIITFDLVTY